MGVVNRITGETARCNQNTLVGGVTNQATYKVAYNRTPDGAFPAFRLKVNSIQTEAVLFDDAIDAPVRSLSYSLAGVTTRTTVAHRQQKVDHQLLEKCRRTLHYLGNQGLCKLLADSLVRRLKLFLWGLSLSFGQKLSLGRLLNLPCIFMQPSELLKLRKLRKSPVVNTTCFIRKQT